jgi:hypothetical protein
MDRRLWLRTRHRQKVRAAKRDRSWPERWRACQHHGGIVAERRGRIRPRRSGCRAGLHGSPPDGNRRRHGRPRGRPRNLRARKGRPNERHRPNGLKLPDQGLRLRLLQTLPGAQVLGRDGLGHGGERNAMLGRQSRRQTCSTRRARIGRSHHEHVEQVPGHVWSVYRPFQSAKPQGPPSGPGWRNASPRRREPATDWKNFDKKT